MKSPAPLGLLLDVDGPIASPVSRRVDHDSIPASLAALANSGVPVAFNTGRSDAFLTDVVVPGLIAAGLDAGAPVYGICEKGAVWFRIRADGAGDIEVDDTLAIPAAAVAELERAIRSEYGDLVFFDETKRAMVSAEQRTDVASADYLAAQPAFDERMRGILLAAGIGTVREGDRRPAPDGTADVRIDPTIISTDIESVRLGKDLGATRLLALLAEDGVPLPASWRTMGDSRSDYAMADELHRLGHHVEHVDVRPSDGVPETPYAVRVSATGLIHDDVGAEFLSRWAEDVAG